MIGQKGVALGGRGGGVEKHVAELSKRLVEFGHDVTVYARAQYAPERPESLEGVRLHYTPTIYRKNIETILYTLFATIHALFQSYDVIHYQGIGPSTLAWIPRLFARKTTVIVTFHSQDKFHKKWGFFARTYLNIAEWAAVYFPHYCITVSHVMQVYCRDKLGREVVYIPNGAEIKDVSSSEEIERFGLQPQEYILNVGRLVPQKGLHYLIEAFKQIKTDKHLVFVGAPSFSGGYYTELRNLASDDVRIHFLGYQEGDTLDQLYANAYLYVHPSDAEGLPLTILEAMSFGLAALVSDIPANVEAIAHTGFTFRAGDVEDLREKLSVALAHPTTVRDHADEARATIEVQFNWDKIAEHTEAVYVSARH